MSGFFCSTIEIDLTTITGEHLRLTDAPYDITLNGHLYRAFGSLLAIDKITTENTLASKELTVTLTGIAVDFQESVNNNMFRRKSIIIRKCFVPEGGNEITDNKIYYRGYTSTPETDVNYTEGYMALKVSCKSVFDLDQSPDLMRSNNATHQAYHNGDTFFKYANVEMKDDILWKK
ncbi:hypothetical protein RA178_06315 [Shewanella oncorhynchi]|uniref:Uncharacterized protein n=1 Tax=Shewanella oncorhynchi TaxID=2726434 RepID=A0AA50Q7H6_9GAMM|nr:hypothetical protein [Shewanella oncorhynchi]WMB74226.1 hypothetical protein RA178_06315 [Shewanella oncorhynchi]